jgi:cold shock CspA family protein
MAESWNKKEREKKKQKEKRDKAEKMQERKENAKKPGFDDMIAYLDENGNLSSTPPDPRKRVEVKLEDIQIGVPEYVPPTQFIKDRVSQESVFVHANNLSFEIKENDLVTFETEMGQKGPVAVNIKRLT